jgi:hypothetical protein
MDPEIGSLVIVGAVSAGTAAHGLAKPAGELLKDLVGRLLGPVADLGGENLRRYFERRAERAADTITEASRMLAEIGVEPQVVPGRILMPLLEYASMEEDGELHRMWVALLASSATLNSDVIPGFVEILRQLTPVHARLLKRLQSVHPWGPDAGIKRADIERELELNSTQYALIVSDLWRMQLVRGTSDKIPEGLESANLVSEPYERMLLGTLASQLLRACTPLSQRGGKNLNGRHKKREVAGPHS